MTHGRMALGPILAILSLLLSGCGFEPLYGTTRTGSTTAVELSSITIDEQKTRLGQLIRNNLLSGMSSAGKTTERYRLTLAATSKIQTQIEVTDEQVRRASFKVNAVYSLVDPASGRVLHSGKTFSQVSYDRSTSDFSNVQAETSAMERAAEEIGTDIRTRLAAYFASRR